MIRRETVKGKPATVAYLTDDFGLATPETATLVKVIFDDGGIMFGRRDAGAAQKLYSDEQARDEHGRWTAGGGGESSKQPGLFGHEGKSPVTGPTPPGGLLTGKTPSTPEERAQWKKDADAFAAQAPRVTPQNVKGPWPKVDNLHEALDRIRKGEDIEVTPDKVGSILDELGKISEDAMARGEKAPLYNLGKVHVPGTNLFCDMSLGITRLEMPQVDQGFKAYVESKGFQCPIEKFPAQMLKATQNELNGAQVGGMMRAAEKGKYDVAGRPIFISSDNYILDGHHGWATAVGLGLRKGSKVDIPVARVNLPISAVLKLGHQYAKEKGIAYKAAKPAMWMKHPVLGWVRVSVLYNESHDERGRFASGPGGGGGGAHLPYKALLQKVHESGGFTYQPLTHAEPKPGDEVYSVSMWPERSQILDEQAVTARDIRRFAAKNADLVRKGESLGAWKDGGKVYLDISHTTKSREEAVALGKKHNQISIWSFKDMDSISTGGTGQAAAAQEVFVARFARPPQPAGQGHGAAPAPGSGHR